MTATVPGSRPVIRQADIVTGEAVRARTWLDAAELANWCGGNGEVLVPGYSPEQTIAAGASATFRFRVTPPGRAVQRIWHLQLEGNAAITVDTTEGAPADYVIADGALVLYRESLTAKSSALQEIKLDITNAASSATVTVKSIACFEAPRIALDKNTVDYGVETTTTAVREPIQENNYSSLGGIVGAFNATQRRQYFNIARPDTNADSWSTTSGTFGIVLDAVPILTRKIRPTSTTGNVRFAALCKASDATTDGEIRITNNATTNTVTLTVTNPGTSWDWYTVDFPTDILCEDLSEATGWPDGALLTTASKTLDIDFRVSGGAGTFYVATIAAVEY
jgi:hypothetical protein